MATKTAKKKTTTAKKAAPVAKKTAKGKGIIYEKYPEEHRATGKNGVEIKGNDDPTPVEE